MLAALPERRVGEGKLLTYDLSRQRHSGNRRDRAERETRTMRKKGLTSVGIAVAMLSFGSETMGQTAEEQGWVAVAEQATPAVVVIQSDKGQGSGFLVDANGTIVTNEHVINDVAELTVTLDSGEAFSTVWIVATDTPRDLAILRIAGTDLPALPLGDSNGVQVGEPVALLGAPAGLGATLTAGIVSAVRIVEGSRTIQTTAAASRGSSGSPLVNRRGEAVGVLTWARVDGNDLNFTIPINYVKGMLATESLAGNTRRLVAERLLADTQPTDSVFVGGAVVGAGWGFRDMMRNLLDSLFEIGVRVVNTEQIAAGEAAALSNQARVDRAEALGASWVLVLTSNIQEFNLRESAVLECFSVPSGQRMWSTKVTDVALTPQGAVNDLSRDLARELRERIGEPCVVVVKEESR